MQFTPRQDASRKASLADCGLDERRKVAAALEEVLDLQATTSAKVSRPLGIDFTFEVEGVALVG